MQSIMDGTMKAKFILCMATLSIALAACGKTDKPAVNEDAAREQSETSATVDNNQGGVASATPKARSTPALSGVQDAKEYMCKNGVNGCKISGPFVANSEAEAKWLLSHGYPTEAELARLEGLNLDQLKAESQAGNQAATVIYGKKIALNGPFYNGIDILRRAAVAGNLYAYYGLSDVYASDGENKNLVDSIAYLRLAYIIGDSKASGEIAQRGLSGVENVVADERAASLYKTFSKYQRPSPRPIE
ncbi:hypothetical protein CPBF426_25820 [Xanthomonas arboricola pv. juglandis]|nr:hypothetical protein XSP_001545 [Xanthomonas sp. CPBF 426]CAG2087886.1 hypothetical protein XCY_001509 [Xanthomonas euroxanthea]SYZ54449.1 hypothetical protein CPBF426_25820 [Xanthomonas arboricola pv. juglandis]